MNWYDVAEESYKNGYAKGYEDGKKDVELELLKMVDMTYCTNTDCPFKKCTKHWQQLKDENVNKKEYANFANFGGVCRKYIGYVLELAESEKSEDAV